jgi:hypothetical protein
MSGQFAQQHPWGAFPTSAPGVGTFPGALQSQAGPQPFMPNPFGNVGSSPFGGYGASLPQQPLQQIVQSLLIVPQQLQHLLHLAQIQQHQVQYLLQSIPQQLQQLQQLQQVHQQLGHQSAFQPFTPHLSQPFGAQAGYVM